MNPLDLLWLFIIASILQPLVRQRWLEGQRLRLLQKLEHQRQSRVITLIHRQEAMAFLGVPIARFIDIEDSEAVLRAIRLTPPVAYVAGTLGTLIGADLLHLPDLRRFDTQLLSIGGAGVHDGIFFAGLVAALLA